MASDTWFLDGDYVPAFELSRIVQELDSLERAATAARIPWTVATRVAELHREALGGLGDRNEELSIIRWLEQLAGHRRRSPRLGANVAPAGRG